MTSSRQEVAAPDHTAPWTNEPEATFHREMLPPTPDPFHSWEKQGSMEWSHLPRVPQEQGAELGLKATWANTPTFYLLTSSASVSHSVFTPTPRGAEFSTWGDWHLAMRISGGLGRSPGEGNGNPLQYSCLGNPMDRGTCWATVHRVPKSHTGLSMYAHRWCPGIYGDSPEDMTPPAIWVLLQVDLF